MFAESSSNVEVTDGTLENDEYVGHGSSYTRVDDMSLVINGDVTNGQESRSVPVREHTLKGGSVRNGSTLVNGDTYKDLQSFSVFNRKG